MLRAGAILGNERMTDDVLEWAKGQRDIWASNLKALRSGALGTTELRDGKRVDTTLETIAERKRDLAGLDAMIGQDDRGRPVIGSGRQPLIGSGRQLLIGSGRMPPRR